jgi:AcrR family transcriptional regulator
LAHEVVKRVGDRAYRYRVESYRDRETGKVRGRWTYLGRVAVDATVAPLRPARERTRDRLLAALERLLEDAEYADVSAGQIAEAAGLAHGTFYRYFRDKHAALREAIERVREAVDRERVALGGPIGTVTEERDRVRAWADAVLHAPIDRRGLLRAWLAVSDADPEVAERRTQRRAASVAAFTDYLQRGAAAGTIVVDDAAALAVALLSLFDGVLRIVASDRDPGAQLRAGVIAVFDRAIFGVQ